MADNTTINKYSGGDTIATRSHTEDDGTEIKTQEVLAAFGVEGQKPTIASLADPYPVFDEMCWLKLCEICDLLQCLVDGQGPPRR